MQITSCPWQKPPTVVRSWGKAASCVQERPKSRGEGGGDYTSFTPLPIPHCKLQNMEPPTPSPPLFAEIHECSVLQCTHRHAHSNIHTLACTHTTVSEGAPPCTCTCTESTQHVLSATVTPMGAVRGEAPPRVLDVHDGILPPLLAYHVMLLDTEFTATMSTRPSLFCSQRTRVSGVSAHVRRD